MTFRNPSRVDVRGIWTKLKMIIKDVQEKVKSMKICRKTDIPLRSALGMVGWNPVSPVERAVEFHQYDLQNGVAAEVLSGGHHSVSSDMSDAAIADLRGLEYILKYQSEPFQDKVGALLIFFEHCNRYFQCYLQCYT